MTLGDCSAFFSGVEFVSRMAYGFARLHSVDWIHGWDAAPVVLDGSDTRLPAAEKLRAGVFLSVPGAVFLLWRIAAGAECADLLCRAAGAADCFCQDCFVRRAVPLAAAVSPPAPRVCRDARDAAEPRDKAPGAGGGVRADIVFRVASVSAAGGGAGF